MSVDEVISLAMSVKDVEDWFVWRNKLVITFEEELYLYELQTLNNKLLTMNSAVVDNVFAPCEDANMKKLFLKL